MRTVGSIGIDDEVAVLVVLAKASNGVDEGLCQLVDSDEGISFGIYPLLVLVENLVVALKHQVVIILLEASSNLRPQGDVLR